ncbi:MAG: glycine cleavage system protein H [Deltaproteobacteria bacterium]|nr:glycine cleavage system protein H [Deltaproteobacteria bacterium]
MAIFNECNIPEDLYYDIENQVWGRKNGDGTFTFGMTDPAQSLAGKILYADVKAVGKIIKKGKSAATIESGKYVGPFPMPFSGEIVDINHELEKDSHIINIDPYEKGWIVRLKPLPESLSDINSLLTGEEAVKSYIKKLEDEDIICKKR